MTKRKNPEDKLKTGPKSDKLKELSEKQLKAIRRMAECGIANEHIAGCLNMSQAYFYKLIEKYPEILETIKNGRADGVNAVAQTLLQKAREGNMTAIIFFLKTRGGFVEHQPDQSKTNIVFKTEITPTGEFKRTEMIEGHPVIDVEPSNITVKKPGRKPKPK